VTSHHEAGHMSAPDDAPKSALKIPLVLRAVTYVAQIAPQVFRINLQVECLHPADAKPVFGPVY
jgi:hypothetical protein